MSSLTDFKRAWLLPALGLLAAAGIGFAIARFTAVSALPITAAAVKGATADTLTLPESALTMMNITIETVTAANLAAEIDAPATVVATASGQASVGALATGTVVRINKRLGDAVTAGEVLALVESPQAAAMKADQTAAAANAALLKSVVAREQGLYDQHVTARQELETAQAQLRAAEAESVRAQAAFTSSHVTSDGKAVSVTSPLAGRITAMNAALGMRVEPAVELFRVVDPLMVAIEAAIPASEAAHIAVGDSARVRLSAGKELQAMVVAITPAVDVQTRSATATLAFTKTTESLPTVGEVFRVVISTQQGASTAVVVPEESIQSIDGRDAVFVRTAQGFRIQTVVVGVRSAGRVSIVSGLDKDMSIATTNAFLLKAEAKKGAEE